MSDLLEERIKDEKIKVQEAVDEIMDAEKELIAVKTKISFFHSNLKQRNKNLKILLKRRRSNG